MNSAIIGTGSFVPYEPVPNSRLEDRLRTTDEWIRTRTGICQRHYAGEMTSLEMARSAAAAALASAGLSAREIDLIVVATISGDMVFPSLASLLQDSLGARSVGAFDVAAACSGFIYALGIADSMICAKRARHVLVVGAEKMSRLLNPEDRATSVLFGDGAGAVVLSRVDRTGIRAVQLFSDGSTSRLLNCAPALGSPFIHMVGPAVFRMAVRAMSQAAQEALESTGLRAEDIACFVPHQANLRIIEAVAAEVGISMTRVIVTLNVHGNVSAASIPIALDSAVRSGRIQRGDKVLMAAVGGGLTWASAVLEW